MTVGNVAHKNTTVEQALPVGTVLSGDQFTITGQLGAGGFGITYHARDNVLGRTIVIKECFPRDLCFRDGENVVVRNEAHTEQMRSIISMFMREARSLAKLRHPNIVGVHRAFEENETAYMALDLIDGRDLSDILESKSIALSPGRVKDILMQLLDAIEKIHEVDLLHRDISPDNILIEKSGTPVLIDFGSARGDASRHTRAVSSLLVVKDGYSPQELYVAGSEQRPCSDLYALAATFYHVISGEAPANSQTRMVEIAGKQLDPCVPLAGRIGGYAPEFLQAIDTAMQIHPSKRLQTAAKWKSLIADAGTDADAVASTQYGGRPSSKDVSLEFEISLSRLVEETNDEVRRTSQIPVNEEVVVAPSETAQKPEWIEEFNRESLVRSDEAVAADHGTVALAESSFDEVGKHDSCPTPEPASSQAPTNWVDRALEKQEQIRREHERQLEIFDDRTGPVSASDPAHDPTDVPDYLTVNDPSEISRRSKYRPISLLFLLVCFCFVFFLDTP